MRRFHGARVSRPASRRGLGIGGLIPSREHRTHVRVITTRRRRSSPAHPAPWRARLRQIIAVSLERRDEIVHGRNARADGHHIKRLGPNEAKLCSVEVIHATRLRGSPNCNDRTLHSCCRLRLGAKTTRRVFIALAQVDNPARTCRYVVQKSTARLQEQDTAPDRNRGPCHSQLKSCHRIKLLPQLRSDSGTRTLPCGRCTAGTLPLVHGK